MLINKIKDYWLHIIMGLVMIALTIMAIAYLHTDTEFKKNYIRQNYNEYCTDKSNNPAPQEACEQMQLDINRNYSYFANLTKILLFSNKFPKGYVLILIVVIPACYITVRYLKSKIVFNELTRRSFKEIKKKLFMRSYSSIIIPIIMLLVTFITCFIMSKYISFQDWEEQYGLITWKISSIKKPIMFHITYIFANVLYLLTYVNITIIMCRKYHNFFASTLLTLLTIFGIELFLEIFVDALVCSILLKLNIGVTFNILNNIIQNDSAGLIGILLFSIVMFVSTFIVALKSYKNKEKFIINCEGDL